MADISFDFTLELTEEQKTMIESMLSIAKMDKGKLIFTLKNEKALKGYIVAEYRVELINDFLDAHSKKKSKIKKENFKSIYSKDKLID